MRRLTPVLDGMLLVFVPAWCIAVAIEQWVPGIVTLTYSLYRMLGCIAALACMRCVATVFEKQ